MCSGKCSVTLLNELEDVRTYLEKEDTFFYSMVYDPNQKTLLVDKGEIRVGADYQAEVPPYISPGEWSWWPACIAMLELVKQWSRLVVAAEVVAVSTELSCPCRVPRGASSCSYQGLGAQQDAGPQGGAVLGGGPLHWDLCPGPAGRCQETSDQFAAGGSCRLQGHHSCELGCEVWRVCWGCEVWSVLGCEVWSVLGCEVWRSSAGVCGVESAGVWTVC